LTAWAACNEKSDNGDHDAHIRSDIKLMPEIFAREWKVARKV